jgi:hypothetical protein
LLLHQAVAKCGIQQVARQEATCHLFGHKTAEALPLALGLLACQEVLSLYQNCLYELIQFGAQYIQTNLEGRSHV